MGAGAKMIPFQSNHINRCCWFEFASTIAHKRAINIITTCSQVDWALGGQGLWKGRERNATFYWASTMDHLRVRWFHICISLNPRHTLTGMHDIISFNRGGHGDSKVGSNRYRVTLWIMEKHTYYENCLPVRVVFTPKCLPPFRAVIASLPMCPDCALHHTQPRCSPGKRGWLPCLATWPGPVSSDKSWTGAVEESHSLASCVLGQGTAPQFPQLKDGMRLCAL